MLRVGDRSASVEDLGQTREWALQGTTCLLSSSVHKNQSTLEKQDGGGNVAPGPANLEP